MHHAIFFPKECVLHANETTKQDSILISQ